jgi:two-component system, response regulator PdtaR
MTQWSLSDRYDVASSSDRAPEDKGTPKAERRGGRPDQQRGVLVVEDDFLIAMQAEAALREAGFDVTGVAISADDGQRIQAGARYHGIMDIRLAGRRDGVEAAGDLFREFSACVACSQPPMTIC